MKQVIDLNEIIEKLDTKKFLAHRKSIAKAVMREAINQALNLAAENAQVISNPEVIMWPIVDKKSILSVKDLIK